MQQKAYFFFVSVRRAGLILLESAPNGLDLSDVQHDLEKVCQQGLVSSKLHHHETNMCLGSGRALRP